MIMSYVSRCELRKAYEDCIQKKRLTTNANNFEIDDNVKLENLYIELNSMKYTIGKSIVFLLFEDIRHPCKAYREVFAADFKDRIVHHLLINRLLPTIEEYLIDDNYACRKGKGTLYGVLRCQEKLKIASCNGTIKELYILKGDFHNCFNTFDKRKIYKLFEKFVINNFPNDKNMIFNLWLLKMIISHCPQKEGNYIRKQNKKYWSFINPQKSLFNLDDDHGIAVGNLTSQVFANFFLSLFDNYIKYVLKYEYYGRYVDDFYLIHYSKDKLLNDYKLLCQFAEDVLEMKINTNKLYIQHYSKGVRFIGYMIYWNRMYLKTKTIQKFVKAVHQIERIILERFSGNMNISVITAKRIMSTWNSYIGMFTHTNSYNEMLRVIRNLNPIVKEKMLKVFSFDTKGFIRLRKHMKAVEFNSIMYGRNKTSICLPENNSNENISAYYSAHIHKQTKAEEYEMLKNLGLDYSYLKKNKNSNDLPF